MRKMMGWGVAFVLVCGLVPGCGSKAPTADDSVALYDEATTILVNVKEEKDVDAAKPKLDAVAEKFKKLGESMAKNKPGTMSEADMKKVMDAGLKYTKEGMRVSALGKNGAKLVSDFGEAVAKAMPGPGATK